MQAAPIATPIVTPVISNIICSNNVFLAKKAPKTAITEMFDLLQKRIAEYNFTCKLLRHTIRGAFFSAITKVVNLFAASYSQLQDYYVEFSTAMLAKKLKQSPDSAARHIRKMLALGFLEKTDIAPKHSRYARFNKVYRVNLAAINSEAIKGLIKQDKEDGKLPYIGLHNKQRPPHKRQPKAEQPLTEQPTKQPTESQQADANNQVAQIERPELAADESQQDQDIKTVYVEWWQGDGEVLEEVDMTDEEAASSPYVSPAKFEAANQSPCIAFPVYCVMPFYANLTQLNRKIQKFTNQLKINSPSFCYSRNLRHIFNSKLFKSKRYYFIKNY